MKMQVHWKWSLGLALAALPLAGRCEQEAPSDATSTASGVAQQPPPGAVALATAAPTNALAVQSAETDLADAAFRPISTEKPLPANLKPTGPVAEVIRLAEAGVDEGVMLAYVTNSPTRFNLGPDGIIYLNDIGVPGAVITAMIQRDQALKGLPANDSTPAAAAPAPTAPANQFAPVPDMPAPEPAPLPTAQPPQEMASESTAPPEYGPVDSTLPPPDDGAYSTFYDALAPYGTWVDVAGYGPCWQPTVVLGNPYWQPYLNGGRWVYTDCGWYWLSDYSWGWAPFHYGRWFCHHRLGWCWAPDTVWGPSWVCWRYTTAYCGWAPLPPGAWYRTGAGLRYRGRQVGNTFGFGLGVRSFAFVDFNHFWDHHLPQYAVPRQQASRIMRQTMASAWILDRNKQIINNGLSPARVAASTHTEIRRVAVHTLYAAATQGVRAERLEATGNTLSVLRPNWLPPAGTPPAAGEWGNRNDSKTSGSRPTAPLVLYGAGRSAQSAGGNGGTAVRQVVPRGALVVSGRKEVTTDPTTTDSSAPNAPQAVTTPNFSSPKPNMDQRPQTQPSVVSEVQRVPYPAWSAPAPAPVERHYTVPTYQAPEVPRAAPAPTYTPPHTYSPPPAPAPAAPSHSSSDRSGR